MSRKIDFSKPLTDDERQYLVDRNRHREIEKADAGETVVAPDLQAAKDEEPAQEAHDDDRMVEWIRSLSSNELTAELENREEDSSGKKQEKQRRLYSLMVEEKGEKE